MLGLCADHRVDDGSVAQEHEHRDTRRVESLRDCRGTVDVEIRDQSRSRETASRGLVRPFGTGRTSSNAGAGSPMSTLSVPVPESRGVTLQSSSVSRRLCLRVRRPHIVCVSPMARCGRSRSRSTKNIRRHLRRHHERGGLRPFLRGGAAAMRSCRERNVLRKRQGKTPGGFRAATFVAEHCRPLRRRLTFRMRLTAARRPSATAHQRHSPDLGREGGPASQTHCRVCKIATEGNAASTPLSGSSDQRESQHQHQQQPHMKER